MMVTLRARAARRPVARYRKVDLNMSPMPQRTANVAPPSNLYTAVLAVAFATVLATAAYVAYQCYSQYGTIFGMP